MYSYDDRIRAVRLCIVETVQQIFLYLHTSPRQRLIAASSSSFRGLAMFPETWPSSPYSANPFSRKLCSQPRTSAATLFCPFISPFAIHRNVRARHSLCSGSASCSTSRRSVSPCPIRKPSVPRFLCLTRPRSSAKSRPGRGYRRL